MARPATSPVRYQRRPTATPELSAIVHRAQELTGASGVAVGLAVNNGQEIECCATSGLTAPPLGRTPLLEESLTGLCMSCGKQLRFDKTRTSTGGAVVVTPIGREGQVIGVLAVFGDTPDLLSEVCLASLRDVAGQITEILWDERGPGQDRVPIPAFTDVNAADVSQPKPSASVRLPLSEKTAQPPPSEPQAENATPKDGKPMQTSLATLEALAAQPEPSPARKGLWIAGVVLMAIGGSAIWAYRAKANTPSLIPIGLHSSEAQLAGIPATLSIDPASVTIRPGNTFALDVTLSRGQGVSSIPVLINYDPLIMRVVSVSNGEFLSRDGNQVVLAHRDDSSSGTLRIHAQRLQGSPALSGDGTVFRLIFMAVARGSGTVSIVPETGREDQIGNKPQAVSQAVVTVK